MPPVTVADRLRGKVVVVSPHLDDGALSLGATMAFAARRGAQVTLLTVFACDPESHAESGGWDRRAGHRTEGESARARGEEDRRAGEILGVTPVWLPYGSADYDRHGDEADVRDAVLAALDGADTVLLPGFPLTHPDHAWLMEVLGPDSLRSQVGLYAEQPYTRRQELAPRLQESLEHAFGESPSFVAMRVGARDRVAKWRALRAYRSQLPLLGMSRSLRRGPISLAWAAEVIAWPSGHGRAPV